MSRSRSRTVALVAAAIVLTQGRSLFAEAAPSATPRVCKGDCDADRQVTVDELLDCVNRLLGALPPSACEACDDPGADVTITSIQSAVNNALSGCPLVAPTPTPCATPVCPGAVLPPLCIPFDNPCSCYCEATPVPTSTRPR